MYGSFIDNFVKAYWVIRELKQPRRWWQQKPHKFAYLTMKNSIFACFARAFFIFWHFEDVLVLSTTWNDLFCSCVDDVSTWWQLFSFVFLCPKRWFQFNSWIVGTHFSSIMSLNNWKMIAETRSHIFRWRSRFHRCRVCLSSLFTLNNWGLNPSYLTIHLCIFSAANDSLLSLFSHYWVLLSWIIGFIMIAIFHLNTPHQRTTMIFR